MVVLLIKNLVQEQDPLVRMDFIVLKSIPSSTADVLSGRGNFQILRKLEHFAIATIVTDFEMVGVTGLSAAHP